MTTRERRERNRLALSDILTQIDAGVPPGAVIRPMLRALLDTLEDLSDLDRAFAAHCNKENAHNF